MESKRVRVADAAKEIGCHPEYLRRRMKAGHWNLGNVVKPDRDGTNYQYFIFRDKLNKFLSGDIPYMEKGDKI